MPGRLTAPSQMLWPFRKGEVPVLDTPLSAQTRGIYIGGAGDLEVEWIDGTTSIFVALPAGTLLPVRVNQVNSAGTTATDLLAVR